MKMDGLHEADPINLLDATTNQDILDYAYMNGVCGEKVDHLTAAERWQRYPALPGNPEGTGKYLLQIGNGGLFLDALRNKIGNP